MAGANDILGTSGKEAIPFEYQVEEQKIARQRAMAQAMLVNGLKGPAAPQQFGRHRARTNPLQHVASALNTYMGNKGLASADKSSLELTQRMGGEQRADIAKMLTMAQGNPGIKMPQEGPPMEGQDSLPPITTGSVAPDVKGAIASAMSSKFGRVNAMGLDMQKNQRDMLMEQSKMIGASDPAAGARRLQLDSHMAPVAPITAPSIQSTTVGGNPVAFTQDLKGKTDFKFAPKEAVTNINTGAKVNTGIDLDQIKMLGDSRGNALSAQNSINTTIRINQLANQGADSGGGATPRQAIRKFGQAFGVEVPETGLTEEMRMQMGNNVLEAARKLAPVTGNDVILLQQLLGSIDTDPRAMKEINALMLAKGLMTQDLHNKQVEEVRSVSDADPRKYDPYRIKRGDVNTQDSALLGRAYQLMKDAGHDMSEYSFGGDPVATTNFNIGFNKPEGPNPTARQNLPARFKVVP